VYDKFGGGQPDNFLGSQDCASVAGAGWDDIGCGETFYYACEQSKIYNIYFLLKFHENVLSKLRGHSSDDCAW